MTESKNLALVEGQSVPINPILVRHLGAIAAYVLQQLHYFLQSEFTHGFVDKLGAKWIYNSYAQWSEILGLNEKDAAKALKFLESQGLVIRDKLQKWSWNQVPHYRINYPALLDFLAKIGLKPSETACAKNARIDAAENSGSIPQNSEDQKQKLLQKPLSKNKQPRVAAFSDNDSCENSQAVPTDNPKTNTPPSSDAPPALLEQMKALDIAQETTHALVNEFGLQSVQKQLEWLPMRKYESASGYLIKAIRNNYAPPKEIKAVVESEQKKAQEKELANGVEEFLAKVSPGQRLKNAFGEFLEILSITPKALSVKKEGVPQSYLPIERALFLYREFGVV